MVTAKGAATRGRILEAATDELIRSGREDFALDTVIRTTGTSKGQLFHYFPRGREELLEHAAARQVERINSQLVRRYGEFDSWDVWQAWVAYTDFVDVLAHGLRLMQRRGELRHDAEPRYLLRPRQRFCVVLASHAPATDGVVVAADRAAGVHR
jgi:AcrR family transcriptional regulator